MKQDFKKKQIQTKYRKKLSRGKNSKSHKREILITSILLIIILLIALLFDDPFNFVPDHPTNIEIVL